MLMRACQQEYTTGLNPGSVEAKALELCYTPLFLCGGGGTDCQGTVLHVTAGAASVKAEGAQAGSSRARVCPCTVVLAGSTAPRPFPDHR